MGQSKSKEKRTTIVAEIITSKKKGSIPAENEVEVDITPDLPTDLPPVRVFIHDLITNEAVDRLKDSETLVHEIAKSLVLDVLSNKQSKHQFGKILKNILTYESVQAPTRELIYWSLQMDSTFKSLYPMTKTNVNYWIASESNIPSLAGVCEYHIKHTGREFLPEQISTLLSDREYVIDPLKDLATWLVKENQKTIIDATKSIAIESLKSDQVRALAKDTLVQILKKGNDTQQQQQQD